MGAMNSLIPCFHSCINYLNWFGSLQSPFCAYIDFWDNPIHYFTNSRCL